MFDCCWVAVDSCSFYVHFKPFEHFAVQQQHVCSGVVYMGHAILITSQVPLRYKNW
jgi:hypothetical protein